jgi:hypothetical protein
VACSGESRESSGHDGRCSGFGIGNASNRALEEGSWDSGIAVRWARESTSPAAWRLEPDERCLEFDKEHQRWARSRERLLQPARRERLAPPTRGPRGRHDDSRYPGRVGPLKLATRIPSSRIESAGANRAGSRERPNSPSWCTSRRHASRCREVLLQRELDARARIRRCVQGQECQ